LNKKARSLLVTGFPFLAGATGFEPAAFGLLYAATTKDEENNADGRFSAAGVLMLTLKKR